MAESDLQARLRRLESRQRILAIVAAVACIGLTLVLLRGRRSAAPAEETRTNTVIAQQLILRDANGERLVLGCGPDGGTLAIKDAAGRTRVELDARTAGPAVTLKDENDKPRVLLTVERGGPFLGLTDEHGDDLFTAPVAGQLTSGAVAPAGRTDQQAIDPQPPAGQRDGPNAAGQSRPSTAPNELPDNFR